MSFLMKQLNDEYRNELITPNDADREACFRELEQGIRDALARVNGVKQQMRVQTCNPTGANRVRQMAGFFEGKAKGPQELQKEANEIVKLRQWLFRQGAVLTPDGRIVWEKSKARVMYDHELAQQDATRITIAGGRMTLPDGKPLDTRLMVTALTGPGTGIYVVSGEGHLHVAAHATGKRHHSSLLAGAAVACAGELKVSQGRLEWISNKSGHYRPEPTHLVQILRYFDLNYQLDLDSYDVEAYFGKNLSENYSTGTEFLKNQCLRKTYVYEQGESPDQSIYLGKLLRLKFYFE
jgi:hypothetical protein